MYEIYCKIRDERGYKDADVAKGTGIGRSTFSDWKNGRSTPKPEKLSRIAEFLGVPLIYLMTGEFEENSLYSDEEFQKIVQEIYSRSELKTLIELSRRISDDDLHLVIELLRRMRKTDE